MDTPEAWINLLSNVPALGFVLWLSHRMTTHTIPRLANEFQAGIKQQREDFREAIKMQRDDFFCLLQRERDAHKEQIDRLIDAISQCQAAAASKQRDTVAAVNE